MARWVRLVRAQLESTGVRVWLVIFYVDDVRVLTTPIPKCWRWKSESRSATTAWDGSKWCRVEPKEVPGNFVHSKDDEDVDTLENAPDLSRNAE